MQGTMLSHGGGAIAAFCSDRPVPQYELACGVGSQRALADRFRSLAKRWEGETATISSISKMVQHPAYQEIVRMGKEALPLILVELRDRPAHWFAALQAIANESPVPHNDRADPVLARAAWLQWGKARGYID